MAPQNFDGSTEAAKFAGAFVVAVVSETIDKIFGRKNETNDEIIASVKDLSPLIKQLGFFKNIHSFSQNFIDAHSHFLYGDGDNEGFFNSADTIRNAWERVYQNDFKASLEKHDSRVKEFKKQAEQYRVKPSDPSESTHTERISRCKSGLVVDVPDCLRLSGEFSKRLAGDARTALGEEIFNDLSAWKDGARKRKLVELAISLLSKADGILVSLIEVLDEIYTYGIAKNL